MPNITTHPGLARKVHAACQRLGYAASLAAVSAKPARATVSVAGPMSQRELNALVVEMGGPSATA